MPRQDNATDDEKDNPIGLLIPIGVLIIVMFYTGVGWLLIPIFVLTIIFILGVSQERKIKAKKREVDYWQAPEREATTSPSTDTKPIFDRKEQKEEGIALGTLIPIAIMGWLYIQSRSWVFLIPLFFLVVSFFQSVINHFRGGDQVKSAIERGDVQSIPEIADRTGVPEERVRRHIVRQKRSGSSDVWFDSSTGRTTSTPVAATVSKKGCTYCGFALKPEDRFCPYCGAPIMAE